MRQREPRSDFSHVKRNCLLSIRDAVGMIG